MSHSCFSLLSPAVQKAVWEMGWESFTPIQQAAIPVIRTTDAPVVLAAGTASGKTEAAFLPILSSISDEEKDTLKVLYVCPLKALINDQFERIERICAFTGMEVHKWHGDVSASPKKRFLQKPKGILQITPESLESLFINRTSRLPELWRDCSFAVIDEIHVFLGTERGVQLRSLLDRVNLYAKRPLRIIGLSATLNDDEYLRRWVDGRNPERVQVLRVDAEEKETYYHLLHFPAREDKLPVEIAEDIRELARDSSAMIFCNSRGRVEEAAAMLNRLAQREGESDPYLVHHSSIDKAERQFVEQLLKKEGGPRSVVCTSTLELGIDIGKMDLVIQLDTTHSVSSLKQRIGRTGRREGAPQILQMYTTHNDSLLQAIAVTELFLEKWVEPPMPYAIPYDVLFHQILSICAERNGMPREQLMAHIRNLSIFDSIHDRQIGLLIDYMVQKDFLEVIPGSRELIVGLEGERLLRHWEFYSVFLTYKEYEVYHRHKRIGSIGRTIDVVEGAHILLAGKRWVIEEVDAVKNKVYVKPAADAKRPKYVSYGGMMHRRVGEKMAEVLCSTETYPYLDDRALAELNDMRRIYREFQITPRQRLLERKGRSARLHLFAGTRIAHTLVWMIRSLGYSGVRADSMGRVSIGAFDEPFSELRQTILHTPWSETELVKRVLPPERVYTKYSFYLPEALQDLMTISGIMAVDETMDFIRETEVVEVEVEEQV